MAAKKASAVNPPDSPPAGPVIPAGLGTKLGVLGTGILGIVAALGPLLDGFGSNDSRVFATLAAGLAAVTVFGRMLQSAAALLNSGQAQDWVDDVWEPDAPTDAPSEGALAAQYPEDAPLDRVSGPGKAGETQR